LRRPNRPAYGRPTRVSRPCTVPTDAARVISHARNSPEIPTGLSPVELGLPFARQIDLFKAGVVSATVTRCPQAGIRPFAGRSGTLTAIRSVSLASPFENRLPRCTSQIGDSPPEGRGSLKLRARQLNSPVSGRFCNRYGIPVFRGDQLKSYC